MEQVEVLVIGAGVVGLAVARALAMAGREVVVVEAATGIGQGVSSRNSEVIHAGLYYAPGSAKARLCVRGKQLLYALCASHGIGHSVCGKLVVASDASQHAALQELAARARANAVPVELWGPQQVAEREMALQCTQALWSPTTGIVDSHAFMLGLLGDLEAAGGALALCSRVLGARFVSGRPAIVRVASGDSEYELEARCLVNAAGLHACALARRFEGLDRAHVPQEHFAKGTYFTLAAPSPFSCLVYPAPLDAWLGVHGTLDLGGQLKFGPDLEWLAAASPEEIDYSVDAARAAAFEAAIRRYWPALPAGALQPAYSGVRPKIHGPGQPAPDFCLQGPARHGVAGLVNLFGIESPGLTASMAIAEEVRALLAAG